jgi:hypothetical protein
MGKLLVRSDGHLQACMISWKQFITDSELRQLYTVKPETSFYSVNDQHAIQRCYTSIQSN